MSLELVWHVKLIVLTAAIPASALRRRGVWPATLVVIDDILDQLRYYNIFGVNRASSFLEIGSVVGIPCVP
jgi:hypothetical protein